MMRITIPLGTADAELVKFLSALGPGRLRPPFDAEVIHFNALNDLREQKGLPPISPIFTQGTLRSNFDILFQREEIGSNLIKFTLHHNLFGPLGIIWLRPINDLLSGLDYEKPPFSSTEEARNLLNGFLQTRPRLKDSSDRDNQEMLHGLEYITFEAGNLHARELRLQRAILEGYLEHIHISLGASVDQSWLTSTQEFTVDLPIHDALAEVDAFIKDHPIDEEIKIQHFVLPDEVYGIEIIHNVFGNIWTVKLQAQIGNYTKVLYTSPSYPSSDVTGKGAPNSSLEGSSTTMYTPVWAHNYFEKLAEYLEIVINKTQSSIYGINKDGKEETRFKWVDVPSEYQEEQVAFLRACVDWVHRPASSTMSFQEFLDQRFQGYHVHSCKTFYKTHLPKAVKLGLIKKVGRSYLPVYKSIQEAYSKIDSIIDSKE